MKLQYIFLLFGVSIIVSGLSVIAYLSHFRYEKYTRQCEKDILNSMHTIVGEKDFITRPIISSDEHNTIICYRHISEWISNQNEKIESVSLFINGIDSKVKVTDQNIILIPLQPRAHDFLLVFDTENSTFISEPNTLDDSQSSTVLTHIEQDLDSLIKDLNPNISPADQDILKLNLQKVLSSLTYVILDEELRGSEIVKVELYISQTNDYTVKIFTSDGTFEQFSLEGPYVLVKFGARYNSHAFFWDEAMVSWMMLDVFPDISKSTLAFWYKNQVNDGEFKGLIPREIRIKNMIFNSSDDDLNNNINPFSYLPLQSFQSNNPFFLSKIEMKIFDQTGDIDRLSKVASHLEDYFLYIQKNRQYFDQETGCSYYLWSNLGSGMDNLSRGNSLEERSSYGWVDLYAQQIFLSQDLYKVYEILDQKEKATEFKLLSETMLKNFTDCYFDTENRLPWDLDIKNNQLVKKPHSLAGSWILFIDFGNDTDKYLKPLTSELFNPESFGGYPPLPTVSRSDENFSSEGNYWKGGVWPPMQWVVIQGLKFQGQNKLLEKIVNDTYQMYKQSFLKDNTIFEYYAPDLVDGNVVPGSYLTNQAKNNMYGWGSIIIPLGLEL